METQGQSKVLSGLVWGNTPDTKIATKWSRFSCLGQGDVGEMDGRGWRDTQTRKRDTGVAFACLGCGKHSCQGGRGWREGHENATLGSCLHVWGAARKHSCIWSRSSCQGGRGWREGPQTRKWDTGVAFSCLGCGRHS